MKRTFDKEALRDYLWDKKNEQEAMEEHLATAGEYGTATRAVGAYEILYDVARELGISIGRGTEITEGILDKEVTTTSVSTQLRGMAVDARELAEELVGSCGVRTSEPTNLREVAFQLEAMADLLQ